jgi:hypothetical protein
MNTDNLLGPHHPITRKVLDGDAAARVRDIPVLGADGVAAGLSVGDRWGAYWLHADGMMRLYPPATKTGSSPNK